MTENMSLIIWARRGRPITHKINNNIIACIYGRENK